MDGKIMVTYKIVCKNDFNLELSIEKLLSNEKIARAIKNEFAKGIRNIELFTKENSKIFIETKKELYQFEVNKDDFADLISLAEEDATARKLVKKDCSYIELVDIQTTN
ncbi:hypothetical protein CPU12_13450 [Malaciobacter molluscorum LMG 25693]|uniref:Uncharacterized protein n=1 Tax=Malaciobacter molluscorum LMG 25693 TaxID=870501 RepID=A0A2G1DED7_9BACT|nr:hypothetical protein [Malaciobacter molluscorum]AXX93061.1 hypothetical protein AMOL_2108 [Malaciobacter molluscorum LMG 25693]PHO16861.1 hypothetical protein CPU12_13450 [Malaciobacter molluscorum LMG 25693]RXJ91506.1 hypothetical protein CRV00_13780 [Malaciobacter molluscorum]